MYKIPKIMNLIFFLFTLFFFFHSVGNAGKLIVRVNNFDSRIGLIHFALYDKPDFFPEQNGKLLGFTEEVTKVSQEGVIIDNLKEGYYAMAIYHDENSNNEFDTFLSFPEEKYGFSNDAAVFLGPPDFKEASFFLDAGDTVEINIKLR